MFPAPHPSLRTPARTRLAAGVLLALGLVAGLVWPATSTATAAPASEMSPVSSTSSSAATSVRRVTVLTGAGHLRTKYKVVATGKGYCWTSSFENGHLYRCFKGNGIFDPCWKEAGRRSVVCLGVPWATTVRRIRLTRKLPATSKRGPWLWGLRIGDGIGANCSMSQGAGGTVGKKGISYFCQRGWVLLGEPDRSTSRWTMSTARWVKHRHHYELRGRHHLPVAWKAVVH